MSTQGLQAITPRSFFILFLVLSIPVFLVNLGTVPFIEDEGIRGLVALEMIHSGNYISPTLYGEAYFKKPPLWNWILVVSYKLFGSANELSTRIPTVFFLFLFTINIYALTRKYIGEQKAVLSALMFITCGRILFWDSMLGLIDIMFSWMIFLLFFWIFHFHKKRKWLLLYTGVYALAAIAFMLKALPSLVFLVLSLLTAIVYFKSWKRLLSWQHLMGIITFCILVGFYFWLYAREGPITELLSVFVSESTQRTAIKYGYWAAILQVGRFPFEMIYHFLPWSLMIVLVFQTKLIAKISQESLVAFAAITFFVNILIYWSSPEVYPRYLFMFAPLLFIVFLHLYGQNGSTSVKIVDFALCLVATVVFLGSFYVFFNEDTRQLPGLGWKWFISALPMGGSLIHMVRFRRQRLYSLCIFLIAARLGFSLIVLPVRGENDLVAQTRRDAYRIASRVGEEPLRILQHDTMRYEAGFYLTSSLGKVISVTQDSTDKAYLLVNLDKYTTLQTQFKKIDSMRVKREEQYVYLVKALAD
ncbi:MAG: phospholipid carrier-dependent glycosyltransferase [Saprospiraceae bacterium]|nr:phospholipid carrier-dependent glycosyltransferase [Saprospiraceae bacterium]